MKLTESRRVVSALCLTLALVVLAVALLCFFLTGLHHTVDFNGAALNGAFQLLNPLRRLEAGEVVGRDFQFFHGPLVPLLHFPFYMLFGGGLIGAEFSRWLLSPLLFLVCGLVFIYCWFQHEKRPLRIRLTVIGLAIVTAVTYVAAEVITPSNSLLSIRTAFPILAGAALFLTTLRRHRLTYRKFTLSAYELTIYVLLALSLASGSEQGIAATIAFLVLMGVVTFRTSKGAALWWRLVAVALQAAKHLAGIVVCILVLYSLISLGNPFQTLRYVLKEVPGDQFWYFGAAPQGFLTYDNIWASMTMPYMLSAFAWIAGFAALLYVCLRARLLSPQHKRAILYLSVYAVLTNSAMLGYFYPTQAIPTARVFSMLCILLALLLVRATPSGERTRYAQYGLALLLVAGTSFASWKMIELIRYYEPLPLARKTWHAIRGDKAAQLGPMWTDATTRFENDIRTKASTKDPALWSTYSSIIEMDLGKLHPSGQGHDYIIHALGPQRREQYAHDFAASKSEFVTTIRPSYSIFEEWLWARHWDFYRDLFSNYKIINKSQPHYLWQRESAGSSQPEKPQELKITGDTIILPSNTTDVHQIVEVTVDYSLGEPWSKLPFFKNLPRYLIYPNNTRNLYAASMPPYERRWTFPVILLPQNPQIQQPTLIYKAKGLIPAASMKIDKATYRIIQTHPENLQVFSETPLQ